MDKIVMPAMEIPGFRTSRAIEKGVEKNLLFTTWGGIGDQICAEPTLRYAIDHFKDCKISLASDYPELFSHLKFEKVFNLNFQKPKYDDYFVLDTIRSAESLNWHFMSHTIVHCVDYPSLTALRCQLPISYKEVILRPPEPAQWVKEYAKPNYVFVHAGKHWPSKTFPSEWWDETLDLLKNFDFVPVLLGKDMSDNRAYVDTMTAGCIDLRNRLKINETVWLLQNAFALVCNDSAPLHMAVTGDAWIAYVATAKHPDYITHYRKGIWGWRMQNFGKGGMWELYDICPNKKDKIEVDLVDPEVLKGWLPEPVEIAEWVASKRDSSIPKCSMI
jgi:ADP-heptose:LPS heptosyltransferase